MGENDFSVEHTGVKEQERARMLERAVEYDKKALDKAWDGCLSFLSPGSIAVLVVTHLFSPGSVLAFSV